MNEPRYTALTEDELKDRLQAVITERDELRARVNELSVDLEMCADVDAAHCIEIVEQGEQIMALLEALKDAPKWPEGNLPWHMLAGRYRAWYNSQRQAAMAAAEGE